LREAKNTDAARDRASVVGAVGGGGEEDDAEALMHVSGLKITRLWKLCEDVMMLTIPYFCEDMENFNGWSASTEAIVESIDDNRDIDRPLLPSHFLGDFRVEPMSVAHEAEAFETSH
jgi:hypothetical protein